MSTDAALTARAPGRRVSAVEAYQLSEAGRALESAALVVVRTGAVDRLTAILLDRFAALRSAFAPEGVDVVWDRRVGERRRSSDDASPGSERRRRDRRGLEPVSCTLLDFLVVPVRSQDF